MSGRGCNHLEAYRSGKSLTSSQAILAKCAECMAKYADGRDDCAMPDCPLYPWMPYGTRPRVKKGRKKG